MCFHFVLWHTVESAMSTRLTSNAYYPRTPDNTLCSGVHVCWSEHSDSSFVYGFMILNYGFGTMTATTLFIIVINLIFVFRFDALTELGAFMRTEFLCVSVLRVASGPSVKLASCKSALNLPVVFSADCSKAVVPVLV